MTSTSTTTTTTTTTQGSREKERALLLRDMTSVWACTHALFDFASDLRDAVHCKHASNDQHLALRAVSLFDYDAETNNDNNNNDNSSVAQLPSQPFELPWFDARCTIKDHTRIDLLTCVLADMTEFMNEVMDTYMDGYERIVHGKAWPRHRMGFAQLEGSLEFFLVLAYVFILLTQECYLNNAPYFLDNANDTSSDPAAIATSSAPPTSTTTTSTTLAIPTTSPPATATDSTADEVSQQPGALATTFVELHSYCRKASGSLVAISKTNQWKRVIELGAAFANLPGAPPPWSVERSATSFRFPFASYIEYLYQQHYRSHHPTPTGGG
eukprot:TRINITY_DN10290_c0_g1_i1.p1 TRINITY_DN10290_c0_g1~~TRINITY_DN10290_c0_g1_i1.p1  ORF type:complete len:346 (-),score=88.20 TRINITY_DN10290_c0_g1_i1:499-1476(-)